MPSVLCSNPPIAPYTFKSGKHQGQTADCMMFTDYGLLSWMYNRAEENSTELSNPNGLHKHLAWLIQRGEEVTTKRVCWFCKRDYVTFFSARGDDQFGYSIGVEYTSCTSCQQELINRVDFKCMILPVKFSSILEFSCKADQKAIGGLFKALFLPDVRRLSAEEAFNFFKQDQHGPPTV